MPLGAGEGPYSCSPWSFYDSALLRLSQLTLIARENGLKRVQLFRLATFGSNRPKSGQCEALRPRNESSSFRFSDGAPSQEYTRLGTQIVMIGDGLAFLRPCQLNNLRDCHVDEKCLANIENIVKCRLNTSKIIKLIIANYGYIFTFNW